MQEQTWHPVAPSHFLRNGENIVAAFLHDQEFALWRSRSGSVQVWDNRCPHRGTRFTMGRIIDDRLSCAYHGWEFAPAGQCVAIPAHPTLPVPRQLCAKSFLVSESQGMIWVAMGDALAKSAPQEVSRKRFFCRSLSVGTQVALVIRELERRGFEDVGDGAWQGPIAEKVAVILPNTTTSQSCLLHVWLVEQPTDADLLAVLAQLRLLRRSIESVVAGSQS